MKFCPECVGETGACCDFCKNYNFNGDRERAYIGYGKCLLKKQDKDPGDVCDDFECRNITPELSRLSALATGCITIHKT